MLQLQSSLLCTAHMSHSERQVKLSLTTTNCIIKEITLFAYIYIYIYQLHAGLHCKTKQFEINIQKM